MMMFIKKVKRRYFAMDENRTRIGLYPSFYRQSGLTNRSPSHACALAHMIMTYKCHLFHCSVFIKQNRKQPLSYEHQEFRQICTLSKLQRLKRLNFKLQSPRGRHSVFSTCGVRPTPTVFRSST